jgi:hypothetical protein
LFGQFTFLSSDLTDLKNLAILPKNPSSFAIFKSLPQLKY